MGKVNRQYRESDWFDLNLDVETRTIYMGSMGKDPEGAESGVDNVMSEYFIKGMHILESRSPDKEITILMNNPGGEWYHGMAIYDAIKHSTCHCAIKVYGHAMSMGSLILQAADRRILMPNSRMMIHYGSNGFHDNAINTSRWDQEFRRLNWLMEEILLDSMMQKEDDVGHGHLSKEMSRIMNSFRSNEHPPKEPLSYAFSRGRNKREDVREVLKQMLYFDTILSPEQAVSLGLADEIFSQV
jgi:ATP-dependent Clp endopeptidase proteolytic subunit ClpP